MIEHGVHQPGLVAVDEGGSDVGVFRHYYARWHVAATVELVGAGAQDRAQSPLDALERPLLGQRLVDQRIELALLAHHAGNDVTEECPLGRQILSTLDFLANPVALEFGEDIIQARTGHVHLIKRLHGRQPRCAALIGLARIIVPYWRAAGRHLPASWRLSATMASAARAATAPLLRSSAAERASACASVSTVMMPLPSGISLPSAISIRPRADSFDTSSK